MLKSNPNFFEEEQKGSQTSSMTGSCQTITEHMIKQWGEHKHSSSAATRGNAKTGCLEWGEKTGVGE